MVLVKFNGMKTNWMRNIRRFNTDNKNKLAAEGVGSFTFPGKTFLERTL